MVYIINEIEYVLIHIPITEEGKSKRNQKIINKYNCIIQDFNIIQGNFNLISFLFSASNLVKFSILVPTKNVLDFLKEID